MLPDFATCVAARAERREAFDGVVFVGDGQRFCRPSCPTRIPARSRQRFFASVPAAQAAALVPCKRCAPLLAPRVADHWLADSRVVRGLRLIEQGFLSRRSTADLAAALGASPAQLTQAFAAELETTPAALARLHAARLQQAGKPRSDRPAVVTLPVREPYAADWVFEFLERRGLPGLEQVVDGAYQRRVDGNRWLTVRHAPGQLTVELPASSRALQQRYLGQVMHVFDVHADPHAIDSALAGEAAGVEMAARVTGGIRVPGAWDGFETAVRAILGQQVSVARARYLAIDLMQRFGRDGFPTPAELVEADVAAIGMPGKRGGAVRALAAALLAGRLQLDNVTDPQAQFDTLCDLPGIGPWTAGYIAMRVTGDANAFPRGDWVILKQLGMTAAAAERASQVWSPWRAYALMYIWQASAAA